MVFSDLFFLFAFLPAFFLCYALGAWADRRFTPLDDTHTNRAKNLVLVVFSLVFYAWGEPVYVFLMLASVLLNYVAGLLIARSRARRKAALAAGITLNLLILATFKYLGFFAGILQDMGVPVAAPTIALPIGISFYTFQSVSYLVDVYRQEAPVQRRFADLLLYISMFPQLIAGPIVRYGTVARAVTERRVSVADVSEGCYRFLIGLGKKVIIANQFSEIADQFLADGIGQLTTTGAWVGVVAFTLQIYYDFSGYSDMAIGLGRCLGFRFNENFDHPYCTQSITEFWRRWHISLGTFFRDYLYIPLGGNRRHQLLNIFVVWFLTGMWHGAYWNYILWGLYFGVLLTIEKFLLRRVIERTPAVLRHAYSLLLVVAGFGIFYFEDLGRMGVFFRAFTGQAAAFTDFVSQSALLDNFWLWLVAIVFCMPVRTWAGSVVARRMPGGAAVAQTVTVTVRIALSLALLVLSVSLLVGATNNAFIYTRF